MSSSEKEAETSLLKRITRRSSSPGRNSMEVIVGAADPGTCVGLGVGVGVGAVGGVPTIATRKLPIAPAGTALPLTSFTAPALALIVYPPESGGSHLPPGGTIS